MRTTFLHSLSFVFALSPLACGAASSSTASDDVAEQLASSWTSVGNGVAYQNAGAGNAVLIAYGGYTAQLSYSEGWASELFSAKLEAMGVGHVYAVQGPKDASYSGDEIGNSKLRAHMAGAIADNAPFIFVVAHSSGAFVAHEILRQLYDAGDTTTLSKIVYANLDAGDSGFNTQVAASLRRSIFVYADDPTLSSGLSHNAGAAISNGQTYSQYGSSFEVVVKHSGCNDGARWCLHDLLVTHRPHNHKTYDLADDYTDFANRPVTTEYIDAVSQYLN
jgi:hypothetical protein